MATLAPIITAPAKTTPAVLYVIAPTPAEQRVMDVLGVDKLQAYHHVKAREAINRDGPKSLPLWDAPEPRPVPTRCDICNGHHSAIICELEGKVRPTGFRRWWDFSGPMYDWGREDTFRLGVTERDFSDESLAEVRFFRVQFLGLHFAVQIGRTPPAIPDAEVMHRKLQTARRMADKEMAG